MRKFKIISIHLLQFSQLLQCVRQLYLITASRLGSLQDREHLGIDDITPQNSQPRRRFLNARFLDHISDRKGARFGRRLGRYDTIRRYLFLRHLLYAQNTGPGFIINIHQLFQRRYFTVYYIVAQKHRKRLIADKLLRA